MAVAVSAAIAAAAPARADDWLVVSGLAKHMDGGEHCNSTTSGLGLERGDAVREAIGFYRNSNCRWSAYAARAWLPVYLRSADLRIGTVGGVATGYGRPLTPAGGLALTYERRDWGLNLTYIPPFRGSGDVLWLQAKFRWR